MKKCLTVLLSFIIAISCIMPVTPVMADDIYVTPENFFQYFDKEGNAAVFKESNTYQIRFSGEFKAEELGINQIKFQDGFSHVLRAYEVIFHNIGFFFTLVDADSACLEAATIEIDDDSIPYAIYAEGEAGSIEVKKCNITMNKKADGDRYVFYGKDLLRAELANNKIFYNSDCRPGNSKDVVVFFNGTDEPVRRSVGIIANTFETDVPFGCDTIGGDSENYPTSAIIDIHNATDCRVFNNHISAKGSVDLHNSKKYICNVVGAEPFEEEPNTNTLDFSNNYLAAQDEHILEEMSGDFYFLNAKNISCEVLENKAEVSLNTNFYGISASPVNSFKCNENEIIVNESQTDASTIEIKPDCDADLEECSITGNNITAKSDYAIDLNNMTATVTGNTLTSAEGTKFGNAAIKNADNATLEDNGPDVPPPSAVEITSVTLEKTEFTYNGTVQKPNVTEVKAGDTVLSSDDYEVVYSNNNSTDAGTYKVTVSGKGNYCGDKVTDYKITAKKVTPSVTLSKTSYVWNGKAKKPAVTVKVGSTELTSKDYSVTYAKGRKNVGAYSVKVTLKGNYSGSKTASFKINPLGTTISKVTAAPKSATVKWKKQTTKMSESAITGYQIQASLTKNFKTVASKKTVKGAAKTSGKLTCLKAGKNYYVRIRTYKTVSGKKYYSKWSKAKTVKVK